MLDFLSGYRVCIAISSSFFIFGFFTAARFFDLSGWEISVGLVAGVVCGLTIVWLRISAPIEINPEIRRRLDWLRQ